MSVNKRTYIYVSILACYLSLARVSLVTAERCVHVAEWMATTYLDF